MVVFAIGLIKNKKLGCAMTDIKNQTLIFRALTNQSYNLKFLSLKNTQNRY